MSAAPQRSTQRISLCSHIERPDLKSGFFVFDTALTVPLRHHAFAVSQIRKNFSQWVLLPRVLRILRFMQFLDFKFQISNLKSDILAIKTVCFPGSCCAASQQMRVF